MWYPYTSECAEYPTTNSASGGERYWKAMRSYRSVSDSPSFAFAWSAFFTVRDLTILKRPNASVSTEPI